MATDQELWKLDYQQLAQRVTGGGGITDRQVLGIMQAKTAQAQQSAAIWQKRAAIVTAVGVIVALGVPLAQTLW